MTLEKKKKMESEIQSRKINATAFTVKLRRILEFPKIELGKI